MNISRLPSISITPPAGPAQARIDAKDTDGNAKSAMVCRVCHGTVIAPERCERNMSRRKWVRFARTRGMRPHENLPGASRSYWITERSNRTGKRP